VTAKADREGSSPEIQARTIHRVMTSRSRTLVEPGHEAEWSRLNAEKRHGLTPSPETPVEELLRRGQRLSAQAARLMQAIEHTGGHART
jgi:hypothetical protein